MFSKAEKDKAKLRLALCGPSGSGKTYTALAVAKVLAEGSEKGVAVIDTENGSASKYADEFTFDHCVLTSFSPENYIKAIKFAESNGYGCVVIDSLSHAWSGVGGVLEIADKAGDRARGNKFAGWREATPEHNALIDALIQCKIHVIASMRVKVEFVQEKDENGKAVIRKVGLQPVQRDGMDYEFDVVADIDQDHKMIVGKTRCKAIDKRVERNPGEAFARTLQAWLSTGREAPPPPPPAETPKVTPRQSLIAAVVKWSGVAEADKAQAMKDTVAAYRFVSPLSEEKAGEMLVAVQADIDAGKAWLEVVAASQQEATA